MFAIFFSFSKNRQYFPTKQKKMWEKKKNMRMPDWPQLRPPAGQETDFFCGQPNVHANKILQGGLGRDNRRYRL